MKTISLSIFLLFIFLTSSYATHSVTKLPITKNYLEAKKLSAKENKKIFAFFTDDNNKFTEVKSSEIAEIEENFIALLVDINSFEGATLKDYYKITRVPEILLLDHTGAVVKRTNQELSPSDLSVFLDIEMSVSGDVSTSSEVKNAKDSEQLSPTSSTDRISKASTRISTSSTQHILPTEEAIIPHEEAPAIATPMVIEKQEKEITKVENKSPTSTEKYTSYGIQTGVFSSVENAEKHSFQLKRLFNESISIEQVDQNDKRLFKVVIGQFADKVAAEKFNLILLDYNIKGFIKTVSSSSKM